MRRTSKIGLAIVLSVLAVPVLMVAWIFFKLFVFDPILYRAELFVAEKANDGTYDMGAARMFRIRFSAVSSGEEISAVRKIVCVPKRFVSSPGLKGGPLVFDLFLRTGTDIPSLVLKDNLELKYNPANLNCSTMVRAYDTGRPDYFSYISARISRPHEKFACNMVLRGNGAGIGTLEVREPEIVDVKERPIGALVTRTQYGPANRRSLDVGAVRNAQWYEIGIPRDDVYYWKPEAKCWESSSALSLRVRRGQRKGVHRTIGAPICSQRGRLLCGFGH